ncbi:MAG: hypothetical protein NC908_02765, partial [Candidatus Omnitrophica bacterium]|nr:hypothetical protein [Candidatus Omnitrophota bacterium]
MKAKKFMKNRLAIFSIIILGFLTGVLFIPPEVEAYQVRRVIKGSYTFSSGREADTVSIPGTDVDDLDVDRSVLFITKSVNATNRVRADFLAMIDDPTHLLFSRRSSTGTTVNIEYTIVEFSSGVKVYSGMTTVPETINNKSITLPEKVHAYKSFPLITCRPNTDGDTQNLFMAELTNIDEQNKTKTLTVSRYNSGSGYNTDVAYQIVAFDETEADMEVQKGTIRINNSVQNDATYKESTDNGQSVTVDLTGFGSTFHSVDASKSFLVFTLMTASGDERYYGVDGYITDNNTLTFTRNVATGTTTSVTVTWCLVEFKNQVWTQKNRTNIGTALSYGLSFTSVYDNRSIGLISVSGANDNTDLDEISFRLNFSVAGTPAMSSSMTVTKETADSPRASSTISWFVTEFPPLNITYPNGGEPAFRVSDSLTITWEHAKELESGGTHADGSVKVKLLLDKNSGKGTNGIPGDSDDYPLVIATGLSAKADSYTLPSGIPPTLDPEGVSIIGNKLRIRIQCEEVYTTRNYDDSNGDFEIKGKIIVDSPDSSINENNPWKVSETAQIKWTPKGNLSDFGTGKVAVEFSPDNGSHWYVIDNNVNAGNHNSQQNYNWNIPSDVDISGTKYNTIGSDNLIRITHNDDSAVSGTSPAFYIKGKIISVDTPASNVIWLLGEQKTITWQKRGHFRLQNQTDIDDGTVDIYYSSNGETYGVLPIASSVPAGTDAAGGSYDWFIPIDTTVSNPVSQIKVQQSNDDKVFAESADFYIKPSVTLNAPGGGEVWKYGESQQVKWTPNGAFDYVVIKYKIGSGSWNYIPGAGPSDNLPAGQPGQQQTKEWLIGNPLGYNQDGSVAPVTLRVARKDDPGTPGVNEEETVYADCPTPIYLKANITVSEPHTDEVVKVTNATENNKKRIQWSVNGNIPSGKVHISLSEDTGGSWPTVITSGTVDISQGYFDWTVLPDHIDTDKVKVSLDEDTHPTTGTSGISATFKTVPYLKLTNPSTSSTYTIAETIYFKWTPDPQNFGQVELKYDTNEGLGGYTGSITPSPISSNNIPEGETEIGYKWTIPNDTPTGSKIRFKVYDVSRSADLYSETNFNSTIKGTLTLTGEANGEGSPVWLIGENKSITWTVYGNMTDCKIMYAKNGVDFNDTVVASTPCGSGGSGSYLWEPIPNNVIDNLDKNNSIKFKVMTVDGSTVSQPSANPITIKKQYKDVAIASPTLYVGDKGPATNITWVTKGNTVTQVKLSYDTNSGLGGYTNDIEGGAPLSDLGAYEWEVPDAIGDKIRVRVKSSAYPTEIYGDTPVDYTIKGKIIPTAPAIAGSTGPTVTLVVGNPVPGGIQYIKKGSIGNLKIEYIHSGNVMEITPQGGTDQPTSFSWTVPDKDSNNQNVIDVGGSTNSKFRFTSLGTLPVTAETVNFQIRGEIYDLEVENEPILYINETRYIRFKTRGDVGNVRIRLDTNEGKGPDGNPNSGDEYQIQVSGPGGSGESVASTPNGTTTWNWTVPDLPTTKARIRVESIDNPANLTNGMATYVASASNLRIRGTYTVTTPNGDPDPAFTQKWKVNSTQNIDWTASSPNMGDVKIILYYDADGDGSRESTYTITSDNNGEKPFQWGPIPTSLVTEHARIRVQQESDTTNTVYDESDYDFKIKPVITLSTPNNNSANVVVGAKYKITWQPPQGSADSFKINFSINGGKGADGIPGTSDDFPDTSPPTEAAKGGLITANVASAAGEFEWTVPDLMTNEAVVRIYKLGDPESYDDSDGYFYIKGSLSDVYVKNNVNDPDPTTPIDLPVNTTKYITWKYTGSLGTVNVYYTL